MTRKAVRHVAAILVLGAGLLFLTGERAAAQVGTGSNLGSVALAASSKVSLTVTIQSGAVQTIPALTDYAINAFPSPVQILTDWRVSPGQLTAISLVAYFVNPAQAMSSGSSFIPSSWIEGRVATGTPTTFTPITQGVVTGLAETVGTVGGSLTLFTQAISGTNKTASRTDNLDLQVNLTGRTTMVGSYAGTLHLRAVVQ